MLPSSAVWLAVSGTSHTETVEKGKINILIFSLNYQFPRKIGSLPSFKCDQLIFVVVLFCFKFHQELTDLNIFDRFQSMAITIHFGLSYLWQ